jgi:two-component system chemotaxis sensor kinase CheA
MTFSDDFMRQLLATFVDEAHEHIQAATTHLLTLEQGAGSAERGLQPEEAASLWAEIFREMHSLKGAARAMNQERIDALAHRLETLFGRVRNGQASPTPALFDVVYRALDGIADLVQEAAGAGPAQVDVASLAAQLEALGDGQILAPRSVAAGAQPASSQPEPIPMAPSPAAGGAPLMAAFPAVTPPAVAASAPLVAAHAAPLAVPAADAPRSAAPPAATPASPAVAQPARAASHPDRPAAAGTAAADETVRVPIGKLDALMAQIGELQVARLGAQHRLVELAALLEDVEAAEAAARAPAAARRGPASQAAPLMAFGAARLRDLYQRLEADNRRLTQVMAGLQDDVRRMRMFPIANVFEAFPRMVRDLARELGKEVRLVMQGGETEVDRSVLEHIKDPLTHLLRNALDHGIEAPAARLAAGKSETGTITLSASQRGDSVFVEVEDDGAGIDVARVRASAIERGHLTLEEAQAMSDREALWLIFRSGFSTSARVTGLSGRGVGMDVVRSQIERLRGLIDVDNRPGRGVRFTLNLPLTVATTLCLLVRAGGQTFAAPIANVARIMRLDLDAIASVEGRPVIRLPEGDLETENRPILLQGLAKTLGLADAKPASADRPPGASAPAAMQPQQFAVVLASAEKRLAFQVDAVVSAQEMVVKNLPKPLQRVRHVAGASILGTGEVVIVLDAPGLLRAPLRAPAGDLGPGGRLASPAEVEPSPEPAAILIADDSITTRTLEKNILEAAGYRVRTVADGLEAWQTLQNEGCAPAGLFSLLVSDVSMPRLDGFELTTKVRGDAGLKNLPVVLVTSLDSRADRERGVQVGADAYITKGAFDQDSLLEAIRRLI